jgi:hypothetical protein
MAPVDALAPDLLSEDDLASYYRIPPRTAQRWRRSGVGPAYVRLGARRIAYRRADVEQWLRERTYRSYADELASAVAPAGHPPRGNNEADTAPRG